jgi:hypothetical protein
MPNKLRFKITRHAPCIPFSQTYAWDVRGERFGIFSVRISRSQWEVFRVANCARRHTDASFLSFRRPAWAPGTSRLSDADDARGCMVRAWHAASGAARFTGTRRQQSLPDGMTEGSSMQKGNSYVNSLIHKPVPIPAAALKTRGQN